MGASGSSIEKARKPLEEPWEGENKVVIGIDIGTTHSGVAVALLQTGDRPQIHRIVRWPGQAEQDQRGKIPTVIWYDASKKAVSFGAEALTRLVEQQAEDDGWALAQHFKLHLHPNDMKAKHSLKLDSAYLQHPPAIHLDLPPRVTLRQIYSDYLGYLLKHTQTYFEDRIIGGKLAWQQYKPTMEVILTHPNGWGLREQSFLRMAAVDAGLVSLSKASTNVRFVTEAEASVHFCIYHTNLENGLQVRRFSIFPTKRDPELIGHISGRKYVYVYSARPTLKLQENRASACVQAGGIFINAAVQDHLSKTLARVGFCESDIEDYSKAAVKDFESYTKRQFDDPSKEYSIQLAPARLENASIRLRRGNMILPGETIQSFFSTCCEDIYASVDKQLQGISVSHILLVGGFGDSPYLRSEFKRRYEDQGCQVTLTNDSTSKAVAEGAVIWNIVSNVVSRAPHCTIGIRCDERYDPLIPEHQGRPTHMHPEGSLRVDGRWTPIVEKATIRRGFSRAYSQSSPKLDSFHLTLVAYAGDDQPFWLSNEQ
ncbi:hypothetical protein FRC11_009011, partial [Ceratobasidium sp. 423]